MKARNWMGLAGIALMSCATSQSWGQADMDSRIVGAYVGAVTQHQFNFGGVDINAAVLFGFSLGYNTEGYHEGGLTSGSLFMLGRRYAVTIRLVVPPFPSADNRDLDFFLSATMSDLNLSPWEFAGTMPYGKYNEAYLRDTKVTYQENFAAGDGPKIYDSQGNQYDTQNATTIEAGRVSTQVFRSPTATTRVRIRR